MSNFDPNADPESIAARVAELSLEQLDRLRGTLEHGGQEAGVEFFKGHFEISTSNQIIRLMSAYAVLKGYVTLERANGRPSS